ncbi:MAG TPA: chemotaxis protein CheB, partial [Polyangia bacterium]|nr:chemotaxis protein CheB [Polyangia bacterium]
MARRQSTTLIAGIGASAGGLEALEQFFDSLPAKTGMAFVVIQHLSPDFKSLMDELLGRHTPMPIHLVENEMVVEPDHVYLIPPRMEMI